MDWILDEFKKDNGMDLRKQPDALQRIKEEAEKAKIPGIDETVEEQAIKGRGMPRDLEGIVSFLATEDAGWMSGQAIVVDGGLVRH